MDDDLEKAIEDYQALIIGSRHLCNGNSHMFFYSGSVTEADIPEGCYCHCGQYRWIKGEMVKVEQYISYANEY